MGIFKMAWKTGKYDKSRRLSNGRLLEVAKVYALDAAFDTPDEVPAELAAERRYKSQAPYTVSEVAAAVQRDFGGGEGTQFDYVVHALANSPEVKNQLVDTSRRGYLAAVSASAYSMVSLVRHFGPLLRPGGSAISLTYMAAERAVPGYGGGMSSAKAALESDTRTLAWEVGRRWGVRVNTISAGIHLRTSATPDGIHLRTSAYTLMQTLHRLILVHTDTVYSM